MNLSPRHGRSLLTLAVVAFALALALVTARTARNVVIPGHPELPRFGLRDFRDAVYYPVRALLDGENPYRPTTYRARYPVGSKFPLYAPLVLAFDLPFGFLPEGAAGIAHYAFNVVCILLLAWLGLRLAGVPSVTGTFALAAAIVLSRPGHTTLFTGECTAYVCLGTYLVLGWGEARPWLAGLGLALAAMKPTFGVPLALLMLARRDQRRALACGLAIAAAVSAPVLIAVVRAAGGVTPLLASVSENYHTLGTASETYSGGSVLALDATALVARLLGHAPGAALSGLDLAVSLAVLALGMATAARAARAASEAAVVAARPRGDSRRLVAAMVTCLTILLCIHHQAYDALLLALPVAALASDRCAPAVGPRLRWLLLALLLVPWVNYAATYAFIERWQPNGVTWGLITSANGAALLAALLLGVRVVFTERDAPRARSRPAD